jgi:hypothetical protein
MDHLCHAEGCNRKIHPSKFVCRIHWAKLPQVFKSAIWREYRQGQEVSKTPTSRYIAVQRGAVSVLARIDGLSQASEEARGHCDLWRTFCRDGQGGDPFTKSMELELYGQLTGMLK